MVELSWVMIQQSVNVRSDFPMSFGTSPVSERRTQQFRHCRKEICIRGTWKLRVIVPEQTAIQATHFTSMFRRRFLIRDRPHFAREEVFISTHLPETQQAIRAFNGTVMEF